MEETVIGKELMLSDDAVAEVTQVTALPKRTLISALTNFFRRQRHKLNEFRKTYFQSSNAKTTMLSSPGNFPPSPTANASSPIFAKGKQVFSSFKMGVQRIQSNFSPATSSGKPGKRLRKGYGKKHVSAPTSIDLNEIGKANSDKLNAAIPSTVIGDSDRLQPNPWERRDTENVMPAGYDSMVFDGNELPGDENGALKYQLRGMLPAGSKKTSFSSAKKISAKTKTSPAALKPSQAAQDDEDESVALLVRVPDRGTFLEVDHESSLAPIQFKPTSMGSSVISPLPLSPPSTNSSDLADLNLKVQPTNETKIQPLNNLKVQPINLKADTSKALNGSGKGGANLAMPTKFVQPQMRKETIDIDLNDDEEGPRVPEKSYKGPPPHFEDETPATRVPEKSTKNDKASTNNNSLDPMAVLSPSANRKASLNAVSTPNRAPLPLKIASPNIKLQASAVLNNSRPKIGVVEKSESDGEDSYLELDAILTSYGRNTTGKVQRKADSPNKDDETPRKGNSSEDPNDMLNILKSAKFRKISQPVVGNPTSLPLNKKSSADISYAPSAMTSSGKKRPSQQ